MAHKAQRPEALNSGRRDDQSGRRDRRKDTTAIDFSASYIAIYDGRTCLGSVLLRRGAFEAFDADDKSLGTFTSKDAARRAVADAARRGRL
jgi:hypothetical protein